AVQSGRCLTYKHPNTSTVFRIYRETLSRFSCAASPNTSTVFAFIVKRFRVFRAPLQLESTAQTKRSPPRGRRGNASSSP
ncbi:hypothetical protein ABLN72_06875, partial [Mycobacterium tuberculosis]